MANFFSVIVKRALIKFNAIKMCNNLLFRNINWCIMRKNCSFFRGSFYNLDSNRLGFFTFDIYVIYFSFGDFFM